MGNGRAESGFWRTGLGWMKDGYDIPRGRMVEKLRDHYKIRDERVLDVMNELPRHLFVPEALKSQAYKDNALPISGGQTISQPFIVARMTELLELTGRREDPGDRGRIGISNGHPGQPRTENIRR